MPIILSAIRYRQLGSIFQIFLRHHTSEKPTFAYIIIYYKLYDITDIILWYFFLTNWVWRVFWYPFCVHYFNISNFGIFICAVGDDPSRSTLIPEDQWSIMIKYRFNLKIVNIKLYYFFIRENVIFLRKYRFFRRQKLHIQCENYPDSAKGRFWPYYLGPVPTYIWT